MRGSAERPRAASDCSFRAAFRRPARGDMLSPFPSLTASSAGRVYARQRWTRAFQPRRGADEPLRWSVTPAARARATLSQMRPTRLRGSPQAPHPSPRGGTVPVTHPRGEEMEPSVSEARRAGISGERPTAESWRCQLSANSGHRRAVRPGWWRDPGGSIVETDGNDDDPRSPLRVRRENVILCLHYRMAREPALGVVRLRRLVS